MRGFHLWTAVIALTAPPPTLIPTILLSYPMNPSTTQPRYSTHLMRYWRPAWWVRHTDHQVIAHNFPACLLPCVVAYFTYVTVSSFNTICLTHDFLCTGLKIAWFRLYCYVICLYIPFWGYTCLKSLCVICIFCQEQQEPFEFGLFSHWATAQWRFSSQVLQSGGCRIQAVKWLATDYTRELVANLLV